MELQEEQLEKAEKEKHEERIVRILSQDIEGKMQLYPGLAKIKGVSWGLSNAVCKVLKMDKKRKIGSLTAEEVKKISEFIKDPKVPVYFLNRRADLNTGEDKHLTGSDLELQNEFDIKRLKQIRSYRGLRHSVNLPSRGQRTRSNFRRNRGKGAGIKKTSYKK